MRGSSAYKALSESVSSLLDEQLNGFVASQLRKPAIAQTASKTTLLMSEASEGCTCLLRKWPDQIKRIRALVNQPIPTDLRKQTWKIVFSNPALRRTYAEQAAANRLDTVAIDDLKITQRCEAVLANEPTFSALVRPAVVAVMKTVLSYRQVKFADLQDVDYYLIVPFLQLFGDEIAASASKAGRSDSDVVVDVIEVFFRFLELHTGRLMPERDSVTIIASALVHVRAVDPGLASELSKAFPDGDLAKQLAPIVHPMITRLFLGGFSLETACFLWDQFAIGLTATKYDFIPSYLAAVIIILKDELTLCKSVSLQKCVINMIRNTYNRHRRCSRSSRSTACISPSER